MASEDRAARWKRALKTREVIRDARTGSRFAIVRLIGRGGYSEVYEVVEVRTGKRFALKCLRLKHVEDPRAIERARREGAALWELHHPNVVRCYALGVREDGLVWMVLDLLVGRTVREFIRAIGRVPIAWSLEIAIAICDGLRAVHGVCVHRDLKPENMHISEDGKKICLFDLGVGKFPREALLTTGEMTLGTVSYMSPEQLERPGEIDGRSDLFSVGVILYELLSGVNPFNPEGIDDKMAIGMRIITAHFRPLREAAPWVPEYIALVIERALARLPDQRFPTAAALSRALEASLQRYIQERGPSAPLGLVSSLPREPSPFDAEEDFVPRPDMALPHSVNPYVTAPLTPASSAAASDAPGEENVDRSRPSFAAIELRQFTAEEVELMARQTGGARLERPAQKSPRLGAAKGVPPSTTAVARAPNEQPSVAPAKRGVDAPAPSPGNVMRSKGELARIALVILTAVAVALAGIRFVEWARSPAQPNPGSARPSP